MALTVTELPQRDGSGNNLGERTYTRTFRVVSTSPLTGQKRAMLAPGVPEGFATYTNADATEVDPDARVVRKFARQEDDAGLAWTVSVEYSTDWLPRLEGAERGDPNSNAVDAGTIGGGTTGGGFTPPLAPNLSPEDAARINPLLRRPEVAKSSQRGTKPFTFDLDGFAVVNACGEAFDPPVMIDDGSTVITITRNVALFDVVTADRFRFCVNSEPFFGFLAGEAMLTGYSAQLVYEGNIRYERVTWTFECKAGGFEFLSILNQGYMETDEVASLAAGEQVVRQILIGPNPPPRPRLLDEDGFQLDVVTVPPVPAVHLQFRARRRRDFAELGVPTA